MERSSANGHAKGALGKSVSDEGPDYSNGSGTGLPPPPSATFTTTSTNSPTNQERAAVVGEQPLQNSDSLSNGPAVHSNDESLEASALMSQSEYLSVYSTYLDESSTQYFPYSDNSCSAGGSELSSLLQTSPSRMDVSDDAEAVPFPRNASGDLPLIQDHAELFVQQILDESVLKATQMPSSSPPLPSGACMTFSSSTPAPKSTTTSNTSPSDDALLFESSFSSPQSMLAADDDEKENSNPSTVLLFATANQSISDSESGSQSDSDSSLSVSTTTVYSVVFYACCCCFCFSCSCCCFCHGSAASLLSICGCC